MSSRAADWIAQATKDLEAAEAAASAGHHEWACFIAQQAAEKAVKAVAQARGGEARGHGVVPLLRQVLAGEAAEVAVEAARRLDRLYIPTRYPNGWPAGKPADYFSAPDAEAAIADARRVVEHCQGHLA